MTHQVTVEQIRLQPQVRSASDWHDRIYINVLGKGGDFLGESTSKVWISGNRLTIERGEGPTSAEWESNLDALRCWLSSNGVECQ